MLDIRNKSKYLALAILTISFIYCFYVTQITQVILQKEHYFGIAFLIAAILLACVNYRLGFLATCVMLALGTFNMLAFTPSISYSAMGFTINSFSLEIEFQLFSFLVLLVLVATNISLLKNWKKPETRRES